LGKRRRPDDVVVVGPCLWLTIGARTLRGRMRAEQGRRWELDYVLAAVALRHTSYTSDPAQPIA
jgi:hypothetical protein